MGWHSKIILIKAFEQEILISLYNIYKNIHKTSTKVVKYINEINEYLHKEVLKNNTFSQNWIKRGLWRLYNILIVSCQIIVFITKLFLN